MPEAHALLLGDSILDNRAYTGGGPDVAAQVRERGLRCTLAAVDGSVVADVTGQLARAPADATHLVVSAGGNDALRQESAIYHPARNVAEALLLLATIVAEFRSAYTAMLDALASRRLPVAVCTVYDPAFPDPMRQRIAITGLALFNDVILREALARGLTVLDLRLICAAPADLANPIEPSSVGGAKIAAAVASFVAGSGPVLTGR
ncbi:MAG: SGNH/GDSL hydrolase family protein [Acetobacteraceae bacterium]|nr:SGNH/GDSL hydrolase family protein [Acetobacteraceae bacterium]